MKLLREKSFIKRLALVNVNFNEHSWDDFLQFLKESDYIVEIDISWACISPAKMLLLLELLAFNK